MLLCGSRSDWERPISLGGSWRIIVASFGNPAVSWRSVALRPSLATGLPFRIADYIEILVAKAVPTSDKPTSHGGKQPNKRHDAKVRRSLSLANGRY